MTIRRMPARGLLLVFLLGASWLLPSAALGEAGEIPRWQPPKTGLGYEIDLDRPLSQQPAPIRSREVESRGAQPLYVRIRFSWDRVESQPGVFHLETVDAAVEEFRNAGFEVILDPRGGNDLYGHAEMPLPEQTDYLEAWRRFLRKVGETFKGRIRFYQVGDDPDLPGTLAPGAGPREYAFLVKNGAVELRGADPDALIVMGSVGIGHLDFLEKVLREDLGPYLDAVPVRGEAGEDPGPSLDRAGTAIFQHVPAAALWLVAQPLPELAAPAEPPPQEMGAPEPGTGEPTGGGGNKEEEGAPSAGPEGVAPVPSEPPQEMGPAQPGTGEPAGGGENKEKEEEGAPSAGPESKAPAPPEGSAAAVPPAPPAPKDSPERGAALLRTYLSALTAGSRLTLFDLKRGAGKSPELASLCVLLRRLFLPTVGPSPGGTAKTRFLAEPGGTPFQAASWKYFDASTFQVILGYVPGEKVGGSDRATLVLDTSDVTGAVVDDLLANTENPAAPLVPDAASGTTRVGVPLASYPLLLRYQRFATPGYLKKPESVEVGGKRGMTAEEILARHQEFQADQDSRLSNLQATARIRYLYKVASADVSVDVTTLNNFFWDRKVGGEWEQTDLYFNGVRWTGKKLPDLPLIQPEKVVILPLDIHLDKSYSYRLLGTDTVDGRECYELEFTPLPSSKSLYRGKVWIDRKNFAKVQIASVQTGLGPPVTSNDERDTYGPAPGTGVAPIWVLQRIGGQQIWNISGVNLVVQREIEFSGFALNAPDFEARRKAAYESKNVMLRDTEKGFRYLDRDKQGERVVREGVTKRTLLGAAGVFYEQSLDYPVPLAGIDYFDFNFKNTGAQVNFFFAGALLQGSIQSPRFLGTRLDAGASVLGIAFSSNDNYYLGDRKLEQEEVRQRTQSVSVNLGIPLGNFFKLKAQGFWDYQQYGGSKHTKSFRVPVDTPETGYGVVGEFDRWGVTVRAHAERHRRDRWGPWGDTDPASDAVGTRLIDFDPGQQSYSTSGALLAKEFVLPLFQKVSAKAEVLTGDSQDRFSKYTFSFFGNRVRGFSGSGVRFDRALLTSAAYSFNIADVLRIEATLDYARVKDTTLADLPPPASGSSTGSCQGCTQGFGGFGLSGNVMGPWSTLVRFDWGIAVKSDIPGLEGKQEISLALLKFF